MSDSPWFGALVRGLGTALRDAAGAPRERSLLGTRRAWHCVCGQAVYFHNDRCLHCGRALGYEPGCRAVVALDPARLGGGFQVLNPSRGRAGLAVRRCANHASPAGCNWLVPAADASPWCLACRLNRTIPDLGVAENADAWRRIEQAKRRLAAQLLGLGLPLRSRLGDDPQRGLMFDFLARQPGGPAIVTGHAGGLVTLDVAEADDAHREAVRSALREPYRTLLGHLRHEVGHYYWDRLVAGSAWLAPCRSLFGDERLDYGLALQQHYRQGPPADWAQRHVSAYASSHPWEDWAETWAHYLHMVDTVDTAASFGLDASDVQVDVPPFERAVLWQPQAPDAAAFLAFLNNWFALTRVLNELSRSMGQADFYPFVLPAGAVPKLQFVHAVVQGAAAVAPP